MLTSDFVLAHDVIVLELSGQQREWIGGNIGMKIDGEGRLVYMKDECIRFAQNLGPLHAMTIGAESTIQLDETLKLLAQYPAAKVI